MPRIHRSPKKNGYNTNLQFDKTCTNKSNEKKKTRKRNFTWFNPPFNINVATNVAKTFLSLIDKHFPKDKKLSKIFNRNTIKVSHSCLANVKQTISNKNPRLLQLHRMKESSQHSKLCNCWHKSSCPLDGKCLTKCVVYKATVTKTTSSYQDTYIRQRENEFKTNRSRSGHPGVGSWGAETNPPLGGHPGVGAKSGGEGRRPPFSR